MATPRKLKKAQKHAGRALDMFNRAQDRLEVANELLARTIDEHNKKIDESRTHIDHASTDSARNARIINKLKDFTA